MPEVFDRPELRDAQESDLPFLFRLYADVRGPEIASWGWPAAESQSFLRMQFEAQRRSYQAAYANSRHEIISIEHTPVGRRLVASAPGDMRLVDIALLSSYRNRGIGRSLVQQLIDECRANGLLLQLQVLQGNPARGLYERMGFEETSSDAMYIQMACSPTTEKVA